MTAGRQMSCVAGVVEIKPVILRQGAAVFGAGFGNFTPTQKDALTPVAGIDGLTHVLADTLAVGAFGATAHGADGQKRLAAI